jgi:transposase
MADLFWLSDAPWAAIEPHIPKVYRGTRRVDDRRVISAIMHWLGGLPLASLAGRVRPVRDGFQPLQSPEPARAVAGDLRCTGEEWRRARHGDGRQQLGQGTPFSGWCKRGEHAQAIGRSRGGRTTKIHLLADEQGRPHVLHLNAGQASNIIAAFGLVAAARPAQRLLADRAYDGDALRRRLTNQGTTPVIPNKRNRVNRFSFNNTALPPARCHRAHLVPPKGLARRCRLQLRSLDKDPQRPHALRIHRQDLDGFIVNPIHQMPGLNTYLKSYLL